MSHSPSPEQKKGDRYEVQVREKGVFKTIKRTATVKEAFAVGKSRVERTARASLRVKPIDSSEKVTNIGKSLLPSKTFYQSKKEPDVFIQRREKRISSAGEKRDITFKGILASKRSKGRKKNIFKL